MMKKRNAATMMAAAMTLATVAPAFADVTYTKAGEVDSELAKGRNVANLKYDEVYNTNFTTDKKDDTLKKDFVVLQVITPATTNVNTDGEYLVSVPMTATELETNKLAIATAKLKLAEMDAEIKHNLTLKFVDANGVNRDLYTMQTKVETPAAPATPKATTNKVTVRLINNNAANTGIEYIYNNVAIESKTDSAALDAAAAAAPIDLNAANGTGYKALSKKMFDLDKMKDITIAKSEKNSTTLLMRVYDAKKTHIETIEVKGYSDAAEAKMIKISGNSDFANHWAETAIFDAMYKDTVAVSTQFRPNDKITRAEFMKIVNKTFALETQAQKETFSDVDSNNWFYNDVLVAVNAGYINGYEDGTLRPNQPITRQEASAIVAKLVKGGAVETEVTLTNGNKVAQDIKTTFKDDKDIAVWADESVNFLSTGGKTVIQGYADGTFKPMNNITRAEALTIMSRTK